MAGAKKHMERSHRSYKNKVDYRQFESNAKAKQYKKENKSIFAQLKQWLTGKKGDR